MIINSELLEAIRWNGSNIELSKTQFENILVECFKAATDNREFATFYFDTDRVDSYQSYIPRFEGLGFNAYIDGEDSREWLVVSWV